MVKPKKHEHEEARLKVLSMYELLDTLSEEDYDNITRIAAEICETPIALITLIDEERQWFKSRHGIDVKETPREQAFCAHAINAEDEVFVVDDVEQDERFHDNPLATAPPHVKFYAGVPLQSDEGLPLGTLCVIDHQPRQLTDQQRDSLKALARQVMNLLRLRRRENELQQTLNELEERNQELETFAFKIAHDIKSPLQNINSLATLLRNDYTDVLEAEGLRLLQYIETSSQKLKRLTDALLDYSRCNKLLEEKKEPVTVSEIETDLQDLFVADKSCVIRVKSDLETITVNHTALQHILMNLVDNAIKYNDKEVTEIEIGISKGRGSGYAFYVRDNGPGIPEEAQSRVFRLFDIIVNHDKFGQRGTGIGLAVVRKMVEAQGGKIDVASQEGEGTTFSFTLA